MSVKHVQNKYKNIFRHQLNEILFDDIRNFIYLRDEHCINPLQSIFTKVAPKIVVVFPISICRPKISDKDIHDMAVEVERSR